MQSAAGWRSWPLVQSGDYGQVYVSSEGRFGYYDDDDGEDEAIVYLLWCASDRRRAVRVPA